MPRYNVQNPDTGLWACFSGISDEFITDWMPKDEYEAWRRKQYGVDIEPAEACNMMDYEEAMQIDLFEKFERGEIAPVIHAHWEPCILPVLQVDWFRCSWCKKEAIQLVFDIPAKTERCPYCGAIMDEEVPE